ncbi:MAG: cysteine--tRNA ligase [Candidatus Margulisbacteria bacterium]|jgi:cysteinyl-tRNA synthetase|nr:cysteine--tRNA ligase [Candidatus Margulisiibacteriota bacterium]
MALKVYNTLTREKEEFQPLQPPAVGMYVCGITPYDETHLGHARAYVTFDMIRRYLEHSGFKVKHVQNITDVDDKIIAKSNELRVTSNELANKYVASFYAVMDRLNVQRATEYPRATENIDGMVKWIGGLMEKGFAYQLADGVYFEVDKFDGYGKLSGKKKEEQAPGARVQTDQKKRSPLDFALWKKAKPGEPAWPSPWGEGRPGWHIECSVMSTKYLGEQFDIHGGGLDLEFPHHENETAQTEALTGRSPWVKYWLHNGFVNVNKQKMSKSLGNFFTLKDIFKKYDPMVIRFFLLMTHYRSPINYSDPEIDSVKEGFERIRGFIQNLDFLAANTREEAPEIERDDMAEDFISFRQKFQAAMDDDFNTAGALAAIFDLIKYCRKTLDEGEAEKECLALMKSTVVELCGILGLVVEVRAAAGGGERADIKNLVARREAARRNKDYQSADAIRKQLTELGIEIEDTPYGTKWTSRI